MESEPSVVSYRRQKSTGVLHLSGIVDIFEATTLHEAARTALEDDKANSLRLDLTHVERLDISALQILLALKAGVIAQGRSFGVTRLAPAPETLLARLGIAL